MLASTEVKTYSPGEIIIHFGQPGSLLGIVLDGEAEAVRNDQSTRKETLRTFGRSECFGEMALVTGELTSADVIASEECEIAIIPADVFSETIANNPDSVRYLARLMGQRLIGDDSKMQKHIQSSEDATHVVSHELKSPLAAIATLAMTMLEPSISIEQKEGLLQRIVARAMSAKTMIEEHLTLSAIGAGNMEIVPAKVELYKEVIQEVIDHQREIMAENGMSAKVDVPEELEIVCDPEYILIVYNNLVNNAAKYGASGTEIYLGYAQPRDGYHYFNVANVGEHIKEDDRDRVFRKFITLGKRGTGIGLDTTREIIRQHGGDIWLEACYFAEGVYITEKDAVEGNMALEELSPGNSFIFTLPVE